MLIFLVYSSYMFRVQNESSIRVLNADIFATPLTTFELPSYAIEFAHFLAEVLSPPPGRTRPFNKIVLDCLDIEAEQARIVIDMVVQVIDYASCV